MSDVRRIVVSDDLAAAIAAVGVPSSLVIFQLQPVATVGALLEANEALSAQIRNLSNNPLIALALNTMFADVRGGKSATLAMASGKIVVDVVVEAKSLTGQTDARPKRQYQARPRQNGGGTADGATNVTNSPDMGVVTKAVKAVAHSVDAEKVPDNDTLRGPSLEYLRARADALGVDILDLGRKKGLIVARLGLAVLNQTGAVQVSSVQVSSVQDSSVQDSSVQDPPESAISVSSESVSIDQHL